MNLLITGICGFAGSSIARTILEHRPGARIFGLDNFSREGAYLNKSVLEDLGIRVFQGDLRKASDVDGLPVADWVIDAAANPSVLAGVDGATSSRQLVEHNLLSTVNLLEYCRRHGAGFQLISTSRVYSVEALSALPVVESGEAFALDADGDLPEGVSREGLREDFSTEAPISLYGASKLASESLALEYGSAFDFPVWINRCGVLAGAGQFGRADQGIVSFWINSWLGKAPLNYIGFSGSGMQVRDCFHPRDLTRLLIQQMDYTAADRPRMVNLGGGPDRAFSLRQLSIWCGDSIGSHEVGTCDEPRQYDAPWIVMDSAQAAKTWGWQPEVSLAAIMEEILAHGRDNPNWLRISGVR